MVKENKYQKILDDISLHNLKRIDAALEGNWNPTVTTIWTRERGFIGFDSVIRSDSELKPSLELYFENHWIGLHCYREIDQQNVFDEPLAIRIIEYIDKNLNREIENDEKNLHC